MRFNFCYQIARNDLATALSRVDDFLKEHGADMISNLEVGCYPWRNGKRLQAVNQSGVVRPVVFNVAPGDDGSALTTHQPEREKLAVRESTDGRAAKGLASLFGRDD